jgi:uncharacterized Tic20 family protein
MDNASNTYLGTDQAPQVTPNDDERVLAILCHVLALFFWIIPPLVIYLVKKDESSFVAEHAKESLNFQITWTIISIIMFISVVGIFFLFIPAIVDLVLIIVASIKASDKKLYRYPLTWRIIK